MTDFLTKANSGVMYLIAGIVIIFVMLMAAVFLFKAYREGVRIGMDKKKLNNGAVLQCGLFGSAVHRHSHRCHHAWPVLSASRFLGCGFRSSVRAL